MLTDNMNDLGQLIRAYAGCLLMTAYGFFAINH